MAAKGNGFTQSSMSSSLLKEKDNHLPQYA